MSTSAEKRTGPQPRGRSQAKGTRSRADHSESDPASTVASTVERELTTTIHPEAGSAPSAASRLRHRGLHVDAAVAPEKEKVSITLDKPLVDEIRAHFGGRALSAAINELLYVALARERLAELVDEMEQEAGPASPEAYDRVLAQWFAED